MSTATSATSSAPADQGGRRRSVQVRPVTTLTATRAEWVKFRSLRSSWLVTGLTTVGVIGIAALIAHFTNTHFATMHPQERAHFNPVTTVLNGVNFAQLTLGILGVLFVTGEYGTGMIRATLAAVPRRLPVLAGKVAVVGAIALVASIVATVVSFLVGEQLLGSHSVGWGYPGATRAVLGAALYLTVVSLLGVALGFIVRSTAGGIGALFGLLLILPVIFEALPSSWNATVGPYLPSNAGGALWQLSPDHALLSPWAGFGIFCAWTAAALVVAGLLLRRRDA
ncbi:MAG TPA: ABC transporter permease subunit [Acidimicrobiales bacterium]|nr:ABC transporter permease subunit [Acidimicrobiales bacterium]